MSFTATTRVATALGKHAISSLHPGDKVWAYNPHTRTMELQPILHIWINHDNDLVDLTLVSSKKSGPDSSKSTQKSEVIHTNQRHPFLTQEQGFLPVSKLQPGMHILRADGSVGLVAQKQIVPGVKTMYNLEVAQDHTFTVGDGQWVVHNCPASGTSGNSSYAQLGNDFHYDLQNGGPAQLQAKYPQTDFKFTPRGASGPDVQVTGGAHPSSYPGSTWNPGSDFGDFKTDNPTYQPGKFLREIRSGKLPPDTVPIWYDPLQFIITRIG